MSINVYNSAGEVVRHIAGMATLSNMTSADVRIDGDESASVIGENSVMAIYLPGVRPSANPGMSGLSFTWDGKNDAGQFLASGAYMVKIEEIDTYDRLTTYNRDITVMRVQTYAKLKVFNTAGELVRIITEMGKVVPDSIFLGNDAEGTQGVKALANPDVIVINNNKPNDINITYGTGDNDFIIWDGRNSFGLAVSSGIYELQVCLRTREGFLKEATRTVFIRNEGKKYLGNISIVPNPYRGTTNGIEIRWDLGGVTWMPDPGGAQTGEVAVLICSVSGEQVRKIYGKLQAGRVVWDLKSASGELVTTGIYIAVIEAKSSDGYLERKTQKIAVAEYRFKY